MHVRTFVDYEIKRTEIAIFPFDACDVHNSLVVKESARLMYSEHGLPPSLQIAPEILTSKKNIFCRKLLKLQGNSNEPNY